MQKQRSLRTYRLDIRSYLSSAVSPKESCKLAKQNAAHSASTSLPYPTHLLTAPSPFLLNPLTFFTSFPPLLPHPSSSPPHLTPSPPHPQRLLRKTPLQNQIPPAKASSPLRTTPISNTKRNTHSETTVPDGPEPIRWVVGDTDMNIDMPTAYVVVRWVTDKKAGYGIWIMDAESSWRIVQGSFYILSERWHMQSAPCITINYYRICSER